MGEALHVGRDIVLLHQVVPHGAGFADVLPDLEQLAHHLRGGRPAYGQVGFQRVNEKKTEDDTRKGKRASVSRLRLGEIRADRGWGGLFAGHRGWHIYKLP